MTNLKGWRTRIVSAAFFILGVAGYCQGVDIKSFLADIGLGAHQVEAVMIGMAIVMAVLRQITDSSAGSKTPAPPTPETKP
jgi:hypothetical protein